MGRSLSESEKKIVAARQHWECSQCSLLLPAAYQVDHTTALCDGGEDNVDNCTAMCASCHAAKTQQETAARAVFRRQTEATSHADQEDVVTNGIATCTLCYIARDANTPHLVCREIDDMGSRSRALCRALACFAYQPRTIT